MHYYKRNLGDYAKKCGRLSMLQHGAYTLLIDSCYDREKFPTIDEALEWTWASTEAEIEAVKFVLSRFFKLTEDGTYIQDRILMELLEYHAKADINKRIAIERETKRKQTYTNRAPSVNEPTPNHKPETINQKPVNKRQAVERPDGVLENVWNDFLALRKAKRSPLTQTALDAIEREAEKLPMTVNDALAMCCARGWQGFKAEWVADLATKAKATPVSFAQQEREHGWKRWEEMTGREHPDRLAHEGKQPNQFIDVQATDILEIGK
jgi:uncharacterized protein YdaU (DUF1376 family)